MHITHLFKALNFLSMPKCVCVYSVKFELVSACAYVAVVPSCVYVCVLCSKCVCVCMCVCVCV